MGCDMEFDWVYYLDALGLVSDKDKRALSGQLVGSPQVQRYVHATSKAYPEQFQAFLTKQKLLGE